MLKQEFRASEAIRQKTLFGAPLSHLAYRRDANGNIAAITDHVTPSKSVLYGYDEMDRLTLTVAEGAASGGESYSYTAGTNQLASFTDDSGTRSYSYNALGNTKSESRPGSVSVAATYNGFGQLLSYDRSNTGLQTYTYNGLGDRVKVVKPTATRYFVYDGDGRVMAEYGTDASDVKAEFIWANPELAVLSPFGGGDHIGGYAPLAVATPDSFGAQPRGKPKFLLMATIPLLVSTYCNARNRSSLYLDDFGSST